MNRRIVSSLLVALPLAAAAAGCGSNSRTTSTRTGSAANQTAGAPLPSGSRLLADVAQPLAGAYEAAGALYYVQQTPIGEHVGEAYELQRLDLHSAHKKDRGPMHRFADEPAGMVFVADSLWVATSDGNDTSLWRLDPATLQVTAHIALPKRRATDGIAGSLAYAGGSLWVGSGTLDRVSPRTARLQGVIYPPHRGPVQVAADASGRVLMASFGYQRHTFLARLSPVTGRPIVQAPTDTSLGQPTVAGIAGDGAWVQNTTVTGTTARRVDLRTLKTTPTASSVVPSHRVGVQVHDGVLWVTESLAQTSLNYCADLVTGKPLDQPLTLRGDSVFLTADASRFYYTDVPLNAHSVRVGSATISRACRG